MKRVYKLVDLDCANCAAKMEEGAKKVDGVVSCNISFMTQKMTIETDGDHEKIMDAVEKTMRKVEPDCQLVR